MGAKNIKDNMEKFYNFKRSLRDKAQLLTLEELSKMQVEGEAYLSIYAYNEEQKKHFEKTGSLAGIKDVVSDILAFDFDDKADPNNAKKDAVELIHRLTKLGVDVDSISCYYSGSKGFHIIVPLDRDVTPSEFKQATTELAKNLKTFDSVVSDSQRVLRLEHTKHPVTGLYKIPLEAYEIDELDIEQIKNLAKTPRDDFNGGKGPLVKLPDYFFKTKETKKEKPKSEGTEMQKDPKAPKGWKDYKWSIAQGNFESGERHHALMVLAATCRGLGYDKEQTYYLCKSALKKQALKNGSDEFDKSELWTNIIEESVFSDRWQGGQYSPQNNPWLKSYCERMGFDTRAEAEEYKIIQLNDIEHSFKDYVENIEKNTILTGIPRLDKAMPLTIGSNLGIIGAASSGKTALALSILKNTSKAGVVSVFASLDMHRNRLFEKLLYKVSGLNREALYDKIKAGTATEILNQIKEDYKNVYFYDRSRPTVDDIRDYIVQVEEQTGKKVKLVMIDYFERVNSDRSDDTAASKEISGKLQDLVNDHNLCMITLVQPNKFALSSGPDSPITNYTSIKGSSFLYQSFRSIISIWRPFFNPEWNFYDRFLQMGILKNDLGELGVFNFGWHGKTGDIWELTEEGESDLQSCLKEKEESKKKPTEDDGWR